MDGPGGTNYEVVKCNFGLDPSNPQFQVSTLARLAQHPVIFDAVRRSKDLLTDESVVPYDFLAINLGNGMTAAGTFTAPLGGAYFFAFYYVKGSYNDLDTVQLRLDGVPVAGVSAYDRSGRNIDFRCDDEKKVGELRGDIGVNR